MVVYAYYHDCDPIKSKQVRTKDQIFPLFVMQLMGDYPGIPGLVSSVVLSVLSAAGSMPWPVSAFLTVCSLVVESKYQKRERLWQPSYLHYSLEF